MIIHFMLPAFNEQDNIGILIAKIGTAMEKANQDYRILVMDDGSRDQTTAIAKEMQSRYPVHLEVHSVNQGLHATMRDGLTYVLAAADDNDIIVTMDADNTHEPSHVPNMVKAINSGSDVVVASRYQPGGKEIGLSFHRKVLSKGINVILAISFPIHGIKDYTCGFRAFRAASLRKAFQEYGDMLIESTTFCATAEILLKLRRLGIRAGEVPLVLRYDQKGGASKMKVIGTIVDYFRLIYRIASYGYRTRTGS